MENINSAPTVRRPEQNYASGVRSSDVESEFYHVSKNIIRNIKNLKGTHQDSG
jgi:hypothetical protein